MALYPKQYNWVDSEVFVYGRTVSKKDELNETKEKLTIEDVVNETIQDFRKRGHNNFKGKCVDTIVLENNAEIIIYSYEGDNWGNYESAGYIQEENSINFLVYSTRSKKLFDKYYPDFIKILKSYKNLFPDSKNEISNETFNSYKKIYDEFSETKEGKEYEKRVTELMGSDIGPLIADCISFLGDDEIKNFELLVEIEKSGKILNAYIRPVIPLSVCFRSSIMQIVFPKHENDQMYYHFNMLLTVDE